MRKLIAAGWDSPTTAQFRRDLPALDASPLNGVVLWAQAKGDLPAGLNSTPLRTAFSRIPWKRQWFQHAIDDLRAVSKRKTPLTDNFLRVDANPGDVDWFDNSGWDVIAEHFAISGWIAKQGGLKGICFDAEPYTKPFVAFDYKTQEGAARHSFEEYRQKARLRGRQTMHALKSEFPDAHVLTFFMAAYFVESNFFHGPSLPRPGRDENRALFLHSYGLYSSFLSGWLDEAPPQMIFTDGNEHAYSYVRPEQFFSIAKRIKTEGVFLFPPELRAKYKKQVKVGAGIYLDAHIKGLVPQYELAETGPEMLRKNVAAALSSNDGYTWLYGERGRFWPDPKELKEWPEKEVFPTWDSALPGLTAALARARTERIRPVFAPPPAPEPLAPTPLPEGPNLLRNGDFSEGPPPNKLARPGSSSDWGDDGAPAHWSYWQGEYSNGRFDWDESLKAARASGVRQGCFLQTIPVKPGERYLLQAHCRTQNTGLATIMIGYKTMGGASWMSHTNRRVSIQPVRKEGGTEIFTLFVVVPPEADTLVVQLNAHGQPTMESVLWWQSAKLVKVA
jgi:hypothetical protein